MDTIEVGGLDIAFDGKALARPCFCSTASFRTAAPGDGNSTPCPTSSRRWRGMRRAAAALRIRPRPTGLPEYADCLAAFVDALGLERPNVLGLSFGAVLALELYRRHPRVPRAFVLASAYAGWAGSLPAEVVERSSRAGAA